MEVKLTTTNNALTSLPFDFEHSGLSVICKEDPGQERNYYWFTAGAGQPIKWRFRYNHNRDEKERITADKPVEDTDQLNRFVTGFGKMPAGAKVPKYEDYHPGFFSDIRLTTSPRARELISGDFEVRFTVQISHRN